MAELVTLSGNYMSSPYGYSRRTRSSARKAELDELMGGFVDFLKSAGSVVASPLKSAGKGVGHTFMEVYRGAKTGDVLKIVKAPFKGIGHAFMTQYRTTKDMSEFFYRPSKMRTWMGPVGGIVTAIGMVPGPHSIIMVPLGAALAAGGGIAQGIYSKDQAKKAASAAQQAAAEQGKKTTYIWYGVAALGVVGSIMMFK